MTVRVGRVVKSGSGKNENAHFKHTQHGKAYLKSLISAGWHHLVGPTVSVDCQFRGILFEKCRKTNCLVQFFCVFAFQHFCRRKDSSYLFWMPVTACALAYERRLTKFTVCKWDDWDKTKNRNIFERMSGKSRACVVCVCLQSTWQTGSF